jgi:hypothetical protein
LKGRRNAKGGLEVRKLISELERGCERKSLVLGWFESKGICVVV